MAQVFISYSSKDADIATRVCEYLESNEIACWIAPRNVDAGSNYATQIVSAIKNCDILVLLASENTNASGHVSNEVSIAFDNKKSIIPFKLQDFSFTDEYLYYLGRKHWIEAHSNINSGLSFLMETIESILNSKDISPYANESSQYISDNKHITENPHISSLNREEIVDLLIEKSSKYPYNIYKKIDSKEKFIEFEDNAIKLFRETVKTYMQGMSIEFNNKMIDIIVEELSETDGKAIQVQGLPGSAKNMILQLAFYKMLRNFKSGSSDFLPFYISSSYYEKIPYNSKNVAEQMGSILEKEFEEYFVYIKENPNVHPVLFVEAIREHNVSKISPETIIFDLWKNYKNFNRICAIDISLIKNRARLKRVIPIAGDNKGYSFITNQIPIDDKNSSISAIESILTMYEYNLSSDDVYETLKELKIPTIDIFLIKLIADERINSYSIKNISLNDMYEKLALTELCGDEEKLKSVSFELYDYVFNQSYNVNTEKYNGAIWSLPHKHNTYLDFLIAYYFVHRIKNYKNFTEHGFFSTMLTATANSFLASFFDNNYELQDVYLNFVKENYEMFDVRQKSNALYWLGRVNIGSLSREARAFQTNEFNRYKPLVENNNKFTQSNCDNHFIFRSLCAGLLLQGQANIMDEYLSIIIINDVANAINRGANIEYFGEDYQMAAHDTYYLDTDLSSGEGALKILNGRIEAGLYSDTDIMIEEKFVESSLVYMLTLLQARIQSEKTISSFNISHYINKAIIYLRDYQSRPQNIISDRILYYFQSVEDDFNAYLNEDRYDVVPALYNKFHSLKDVKRAQWVNHTILDSESTTEHTYSAWLMAMLYLPEEMDFDGYNKNEILNMLLIHDLAEAVIGDNITDLSEPMKQLKEENDILKKLFLKGTYLGVANLSYYYNIWDKYYINDSINARIARDINLIQTVYTFFEYYNSYPDKFQKEDVEKWNNERNNIKTEFGYKLFEKLISQNYRFK